MDQPRKATHSLALPYPEPEWPVISDNVERTIVDLLCILLGDYRKWNPPSKGYRRKKKRNAVEASVPDNLKRPGIANHLTIGFNSTVRMLEQLSHKSRPATNGEGYVQKNQRDQDGRSGSMAMLAVIFVCRSSTPPVLTSMLPLLTSAASLAAPMQPPIRLLSLSNGSNSRLAQALCQPRVGILGVAESAPGAIALLEFVRSNVPAIAMPWLQSPVPATYLPVNIKASQSAVGTKANKKRKRANGAGDGGR